jgi:hypothetical protein
MAPKSKADKMEIMRKNYDKLDTNGDGQLDFSELKTLLKKGNPTFTDQECRKLYDACDMNGDGKVDFNEFMRYIYKADHSEAGRHARLAAASSAEKDETERDWDGCWRVFEAFAGQDMDGKEFLKFCVDLKLFNKKFTKVDVDLIFAKVVPKGQRRMDFTMFQDACRQIAKKKGIGNGQVQEAIEASSGPVLSGTKAEYSKFYDDKSTYTGSHCYNEKHGADNAHAFGRHEKIATAHANADTGEEDPWDDCGRVFYAFAGANGELEGKEFFKLCIETNGLVRGGFSKTDIDVVFAATAKGSRCIDFEGYKKCVREIAKKKGETCHNIQHCIARSKGPINTGTVGEYNRFYDDKETYTGVAAEHFGRDAM